MTQELEYPSAWKETGYPVPNPHFPPPPRPRVPGVGTAIILFLLGTAVLFGCLFGFIEALLSWELLVAGNFSGLLLIGYGTKSLRDSYSVRGLWRTGEIVPGLVVSRARLPYLGVVAFSTLLAGGLSADMVFDFHWAYLIAVGVASVAVERISRRLNSAQVVLVADGEVVYARLPVAGLWRSLDEGDCIWIACSGKRVAALHMATELKPEAAIADDPAEAWLLDKLESLLEDSDE